MFIFGKTEKEGWFYTSQFYAYQRVNKEVYCYVIRMIGFYTLQMYERGTIGFCTLEARSENPEVLFDLGEKWLKDYGEYSETEVRKCEYHISNPKLREIFWL